MALCEVRLQDSSSNLSVCVGFLFTVVRSLLFLRLTKQSRKNECVWTETELKNFALVLADEEKLYAVRRETLALKKSSNNQVFEEISKDYEKLLLSEEFKEENEHEKCKSKSKQKC